MNRRTTTAAALAALVLAAGCGRGDRAVVDEFQFRVSTGRTAEAAKLLAPDAVVTFAGTTYRGRAGARRWLAEAKRRRLGFPVDRSGKAPAGWRKVDGRLRGVRLLEGEGYRASGPKAEPLRVQIDAEVRDGRIARITYELTPAAKQALAQGVEQLTKVAAVFDGPPPMYNLGLFAANAVLEVGPRRLVGSPAISGWVLSNGPAASAGAPEVAGSLVRWRGTFTTAADRRAGLPPRAATFEVDVAGLDSGAPHIRRYTVTFAAAAASQPAPAAARPASQPGGAAVPPASAPAPAASQPGSPAGPAPRPGRPTPTAPR